MTLVNSGFGNSHGNPGYAYARAAAPPPLASVAAGSDSGVIWDAATNLTLSDAARAQLANASTKDFSTVTSLARASVDALYAAAEVTGPLDGAGHPTIDLSSYDRRSLFAIAANNAGKFTVDEQNLAVAELNRRFNAALAPAAATLQRTGAFGTVYQAALSYLDGASGEQKATAAWSAQRAAVLQGIQATQKNPSIPPSGIAGDPVADYLTQNPTGSAAAAEFPGIAEDTGTKDTDSTLDARASVGALNRKQTGLDSGRITGSLADVSVIENGSPSSIVVNRDQPSSGVALYVAEPELEPRHRAKVVASPKLSHTGWPPASRDSAVQSYQSATSLLSMLRQGSARSGAAGFIG